MGRFAWIRDSRKMHVYESYFTTAHSSCDRSDEALVGATLLCNKVKQADAGDHVITCWTLWTAARAKPPCAPCTLRVLCGSSVSLAGSVPR